MRENWRLSTRPKLLTRRVLPRPGTPSSNTCPPHTRLIRMPSITSRCPTITFSISRIRRCKSSRIPSAFWRNSALWASSVALLILTFTPRRFLDQSDRKEIGSHKIAVTGRDLLAQQGLLRTLLIGDDDIFMRDGGIGF